MLNELEMLKEIVGDLTGVGLYIGLSYILLRILIVIAWVYTAGTLVSKLFDLVRDIVLCPVSKEEYKIALENAQRAELCNTELVRKRDADLEEMRSNHRIAIAEKNMEVEKVKHLYKILKETHGLNEKMCKEGEIK